MAKDSFPKLNVKSPDGIKPTGRPYKVMVIESKDFQRKQIAQILESESYEIVATAANGKEALEKLDKIKGGVDLITTELDMPILDGYAMMFRLKERKNLPLIVFINEKTTKGVMEDLLSMGIADYILKPINRKTLLDRIKRVVLRARASNKE
ncbi:PleD family two-component system response regulator [Spirochaetota bacterium]